MLSFCRKCPLIFSLLLLLAVFPVLPGRAAPAAQASVSLLSPGAGEAVQGNIPVIGSTNAEGLGSWELTFSYSQNSRGTWFFIAEGTQPVTDGKLADWDTSTLTDGNYSLRLVLFLEDGRQLETLVETVRVRNYSIIETSTPAPTPSLAPQAAEPTATPTLTLTPTPTRIASTPTPLPTNSAVISTGDLGEGVFRGVLVAAAAFLVFGLYLSARRTFHR